MKRYAVEYLLYEVIEKVSSRVPIGYTVLSD